MEENTNKVKLYGNKYNVFRVCIGEKRIREVRIEKVKDENGNEKIKVTESYVDTETFKRTGITTIIRMLDGKTTLKELSEMYGLNMDEMRKKN